MAVQAIFILIWPTPHKNELVTHCYWCFFLASGKMAELLN